MEKKRIVVRINGKLYDVYGVEIEAEDYTVIEVEDVFPRKR